MTPNLHVARAVVPVPKPDEPKPGTPWAKYTITAVAIACTTAALLAADAFSTLALPPVMQQTALLAFLGALMFYVVCREGCRVRAALATQRAELVLIREEIARNRAYVEHRLKQAGYAEGFVDGQRCELDPDHLDGTVRLIRPAQTG